MTPQSIKSTQTNTGSIKAFCIFASRNLAGFIYFRRLNLVNPPTLAICREIFSAIFYR